MPSDPSAHPPLTLTQPQEWRETLALKLIDAELHGTFRRGRTERSIRWPVSELDDLMWLMPRTPPSGRITLGVACVGIAILLAAGWAHSTFTGSFLGVRGRVTWMDGVLWGGNILLFAILGAGLLRSAWRLGRRRYHQLFRLGDGVAVLAVRADAPSTEAVDAFLARVTAESRKASEEAEAQAWLSVSRLHAPAEIRRFHELMKDGVLTPNEFARKKRALIDGFMTE